MPRILAPDPVLRAAPPAVVLARRTTRLVLHAAGGVAFLPAWEGPLGEPVPPARGDGYVYDALESPYAPAARAGLALTLSARDSLRLEGTWLGERSTGGRVAGVLGFRDSPADPLQTTGARDATFEVESTCWAADVLLERRLGGSAWSGLAGLRALGVSEMATLADVSAPFDPGFAPDARIEVTCENLLVAAQAGLGVRLPLGARLALDLEARGFVGVALRSARVRDASIFAPGEHEVRLEDTALAGGGVFGARLGWRVAPRLTLTLAYEASVTTGLARVDLALDATRAASGSLRPQLGDEPFFAHAVLLGVALDL